MTKTITVTASEANRSFSRLLRKVKEGARVEITSHGETVAEMRSKRAGEDTEAERRRGALRDHLASLETGTPKIVGNWTRSELYERD